MIKQTSNQIDRHFFTYKLLISRGLRVSKDFLMFLVTLFRGTVPHNGILTLVYIAYNIQLICYDQASLFDKRTMQKKYKLHLNTGLIQYLIRKEQILATSWL